MPIPKSFIPDSFVPDEVQLSGDQPVSGQQLSNWPRMATAREIAATPGLLPAVGGIAAGIASRGATLLPSAAAIGFGMAGGEAYRQITAGYEPTATEAFTKILTQSAIGTGGTLAVGLPLAGISKYISTSPRILSLLAKFIGNVTNKQLKPTTILEGVQRLGVAEKMPQIERNVAATKYAPMTAKESNLAANELAESQKMGGYALTRLQARLKNQRLLMGKEISKADDKLVLKAGNPDIDLTNIGQNLYNEYYLPAVNNPVLKDLP